MRICLAFVVLAACSSPQHEIAAPPVVAAPPVTPQLEDLTLPGDANGLTWDRSERAMYFADDGKASLMRWSQRDGFSVVAPLPAPGSKVSFGGLVRLPDGSFVITSFGFGTDGAILVVDPQHHATEVPNLDKTRRRVGIARAPNGTLYVAYFTITGPHEHKGGLAKLDLTGGETDVAVPNLVKPVGVAATAGGVFIADQDTHTIYALRSGAVTPFATGLQSADLLTVLPDGSLVTGGTTGVVSRIGIDGRITIVSQGYDQVRGIAYDPDGKLLFVIDHSKALPHHVHLVPLS
jgi:hypothetical protein